MIWIFSFKAFWDQVKGEFVVSSKSPAKLAGAVGVGLFFGVFPIWGFQMMVAYAIAAIFRLNRVIVLFSANISIPPLIPFIIYFSFKFGGLFVAEEVRLIDLQSVSLSTIGLHLSLYLVGASLLATTVGLLGFVITWGFTNLLKKLRS